MGVVASKVASPSSSIVSASLVSTSASLVSASASLDSASASLVSASASSLVSASASLVSFCFFSSSIFLSLVGSIFVSLNTLSIFLLISPETLGYYQSQNPHAYSHLT